MDPKGLTVSVRQYEKKEISDGWRKGSVDGSEVR